MASLPVSLSPVTETRWVKLAREIATDFHDVETILKNYQITPEEWSRLSRNPSFVRLLESELETWNAAHNTHERTRLKAAALIEEWLPEANMRLHDKGENLTAKVELGKLLTRIAEMGLAKTQIDGAGGERFSVTINLGADTQLKFEKQVTPKVIEHEPARED